jgi:prophage regulatory protein
MQTISKPKGVAREAQRYELTGVPTSTWYDLQNAGLAPKPIRLGGPRSVGWLISELEEWIEQRRAERDAEWQSLGDAAARVVSKLGTKVSG